MAILVSCTASSTTFRCVLINTTGGGVKKKNTAAAAAGGVKHAHRLLSSLAAAAAASSSDPSATDRLIRKFVAASSKSSALHTLTHLLSQSSPFALPFYRRISETNWFKWNPKLAAAAVSLLEKQGRSGEAETLMSESLARLNTPRDLALFYCDLIDAFSEQELKNRALESYVQLREIPFPGRRRYESIIKGLSFMGMASDAEAMLEEMAAAGFKPSPFEFRSVMQGYGRSGFFSDMRRVLGIMGEAGLTADTMCSNIFLSCYGDHGQLSEMVSWLRKMRELGIGFSVRTFNTVLNSCPTVVSMMRDMRSLPLSIEALVKKVEEDSPSPDEALLVRELVSSPIFLEMLEWSPSEGKLDLHGFHPASAYVTLLQWVEELRLRFDAGKIVPLEVSIVCGSGKHSSKRGESPIKLLVSEMMFRLKSPMRIDRKNAGRFVARGKAVGDWLC